MSFQFGNGIWANVFAVPCDIVDRHIKLCSPLSLKVLMVLLRSNGAVTMEQLSEILGQSRADIQDALNYWISHGVLSCGSPEETLPHSAAPSPQPALQYTYEPPAQPAASGRSVPPPYTPPATPLREEEPEGRVVEIQSRSRKKLTPQEINDMADTDPSVGNLLQETQQIIGKPLTPIMTDLVVALYSYYGMGPDTILMLIQYCVSIKKESVRYIEKMAASWMEQGIDSHERAEAEILRLSQLNQTEGKVKSAFGIYDRSLIPKEKRYIEIWTREYKMDIPIIELAFERCVEIKGKLSFDYINGILTKWHEKNITTPADAMQEITRGKGQKPPSGGSNSKASAASYDMDSLETLIAFGDLSK
ncbi:DnaD domain protein [Ruminococcaceae bacterium OttesenSCG-928-L11]|nr:DnaD domain protein [Ruminococcaceae bacterium OttesenSCG-928-L11]